VVDSIDVTTTGTDTPQVYTFDFKCHYFALVDLSNTSVTTGVSLSIGAP